LWNPWVRVYGRAPEDALRPGRRGDVVLQVIEAVAHRVVGIQIVPIIKLAIADHVVHNVTTMSERQSVTFSDQQIADLRAEAKRIGITVSDLVRRIVDRYREAKAK
jgi:hypothetical protein